MAYIGYVSMPFGVKNEVNFDELYEHVIFSAPKTAAKPTALLFREDTAKMPKLEDRHNRRLADFKHLSVPAETQLRQEIQRHITLSDFVIADISHNNPNVLLEVGFAQALQKHIIYLTHKFADTPTNLSNLKRMIVYELSSRDELRFNLAVHINEVIDEVKVEEIEIISAGGRINYYEERQEIPLDKEFEKAQNVIQILTTNLTTVSANYLSPIRKAINKAKKESRKLEVTILTSHPTNRFIHSRADQLNENRVGYTSELKGSLIAIAARLQGEPNCRIMTYQDFPVQLWHRIDKTIYIGSSSLIRRTRYNCVFAVAVDIPGIKETYLDHFSELEKRATIFAPEDDTT